MREYLQDFEWDVNVCCPEFQDNMRGPFSIHYLRNKVVCRTSESAFFEVYFCPFCGEKIRYIKVNKKR